MIQKSYDEMTELLGEAMKNLEANNTLLDAYLYRSRIRCGRANCKCMTSAYRHESDCLSFVENGASRTRTVQEEQVEELKVLTSDYKELRKIRKKLVVQQKKLLNSFDKEVNKRLKCGRKRLSALLAKKETGCE